jgi:hypothetical protein
MKTQDLIYQRADGSWIFREPGYQRFDDERLIETGPPQHFQCEDHAEAIGRAHEYLNPPRECFPPPPL